MKRIFVRGSILAGLAASALWAQTPADELLASLSRNAAAFHGKARQLVAEELLVQRSYGFPQQHPHILFGDAPPIRAFFRVHEIVSEYSIGTLKGDASGSLVEMREIVSKDGIPAQTPAAARKALQTAVSRGEDRVRKKMLAEFTDLGLVDVATDYSTILLAFTPAGMRDLEVSPAGTAWIGVEDAAVYDWRQTRGGAMEFRGRKVNRLTMSGRIWVRRSDGAPLRITATVGHTEGRHDLRDDASVDYVMASFGCAVPASVAHRHFVDGKLLTENLYTYSPFHVFGADTTIQFGPVVTRDR